MHVAAALALAERGWAVIPVKPGDKLPASEHGSKDATTDPVQIREWWRRWKNANVGIATGIVSGIWVLDIDGDAGRASLVELEAAHGALPATLRVQTARGWHLYWRHPQGARVRNGAGVRPGLDVRGAGGYVVAPGSQHPSGMTYEWADASVEPADAPAWLLELVTRREFEDAPAPAPFTGTPVREGHALKDPLQRKALAEAIARLRRTHGRDRATGAGGNINETLNREAHAMGATGVPRHIAEPALIAEAVAKGHPQREAAATFASGYENGLCNPRLRKATRHGWVRETRVDGAPDQARGERVEKHPIEPADAEDDEPEIHPADAWEEARTRDALAAYGEPAEPVATPAGARMTDAPSPISARRPPSPKGWRSKLMESDEGKIQRTVGNAMLIASHDDRVSATLGFDLHAQRCVVLSRPPWLSDAFGSQTYPRALENYDVSAFRLWMQTEWWLPIGKDDAVTALEHSARECQYNPVTDYLDGLRWDGVPRLKEWLGVAFGAVSEMDRVFGERWLISAVARAYRPGEKVDSVLVLEGPQGFGKSTALRILGGPFYSDAFIDLSGKDGDLNIQGTWIQELGELAGVSKAELNRIKGWITRQDDKFRAPYMMLPASYPRRAVFAATTNEKYYLRDTTGNRRWWPSVCVFKLQAEALRAIRDQLWAEAVVRFREGRPWHLDTPELVKAAEALVSQRVEQDPWEELLGEWLDGVEHITTADAFVKLGVLNHQRTKADQMRIGAILFRLGFTDRRRVRTPGGPLWTYFRSLPLERAS